MNTEQLFITRKRKKWKFAHFDSWGNCFAKDEVSPAFWKHYFKGAKKLTLEVGAGTANLALGLAQQYTNRDIVAVDVKADRLYTGAKYALVHDLHNIAFLKAHLNELPHLFESQTVHEIWITFPDPFPRKRQAKHRLTHISFLQKYRNLLTADGSILFKTDNRELFLWSLEQIVENDWHIKELSFDLHDSSLPDDYKITTTYEQRFVAEKIPINFVRFTQ